MLGDRVKGISLAEVCGGGQFIKVARPSLLRVSWRECQRPTPCWRMLENAGSLVLLDTSFSAMEIPRKPPAASLQERFFPCDMVSVWRPRFLRQDAVCLAREHDVHQDTQWPTVTRTGRSGTCDMVEKC